jgi:phosphotransferase system IIB component
MSKNAFVLLISIFCLVATQSHARKFTEVVDDTAIATKLRFALMNDAQVAAKNIKIKVVSGVVTLEGYVDSQDQINQAIELAEKQKGVHEVKAYLVLKAFGKLKTVKDRKSNNFFRNIFHSHGTKSSKPAKNKKEELSEVDLVPAPLEEKALPTEAKYETKPASSPANTNDVEPKQAVPKAPTAVETTHEDDFKEFGGGY